VLSGKALAGAGFQYSYVAGMTSFKGAIPSEIFHRKKASLSRSFNFENQANCDKEAP
jgi:hypothetical protein